MKLKTIADQAKFDNHIQSGLTGILYNKNTKELKLSKSKYNKIPSGFEPIGLIKSFNGTAANMNEIKRYMNMATYKDTLSNSLKRGIHYKDENDVTGIALEGFMPLYMKNNKITFDGNENEMIGALKGVTKKSLINL